jgi:PleD family two-component response regulator
MLTQTDSFYNVSPRHALKTVAVVGKHPDRRILDTVLKGNHDIVLIESLSDAYSHIKRLAPEAVIVCLDVNDLEGVEILSMLSLDTETSRIPVVTCLSGEAGGVTAEEQRSDVNAEMVRRFMTSAKN